MTNHQSPIAPPPELVEQWVAEACPECRLTYDEFTGESVEILATRAAQWGADQELEACCEWLASKVMSERKYTELRAARRPKPPSLKEQALEMLENTWKGGHISNNAAQTIRRALEQLDD